MADCIFCKILAGEIPSDFLYEDSECVVFKDIAPKASTHLLVVPKQHIESVMTLEDSDQDLMGHLLLVCRDVAKKIGLAGYSLQVNAGKGGGQEVFHFHIHLLSKFES